MSSQAEIKRDGVIYSHMLTAAVVVLVQWLSLHPVEASTFTVTTAADNGNDASPTPGSLRQAIIFANSSPGFDTINFNIPGPIFNVPTITPTAPLPEITSPVIIDGTTQGIFGQVELDGENAGGGQLVVSGLVVTAGGSTIQGLVINRFSNNGITLASSGNTVQGCFIGTDVSGTTGLGNGTRGILINGGSFTAANNLIGGATQAARNVISGNSSVGIEIFGSGATGNLVRGNYIGTDVNGVAALGNNFGVFIDGGAGQNTIGGSATGARNVISGNGSYGVEIYQNGQSGNTIAGNYIGTDASGAVALGNGGSIFGGGVAIIRSSNNEIGAGLLPGNVISGNNGLPPNTGGFGVFIQGDSSLPATGNQVLKNLIGTNAAGTAALANASDGVLIDGASANGATGNTIGLAGFGNLISGNGQNGIRISGAASNPIEGNRIGTDVNGNARLQNAANGVLIDGTDTNSVGGTSGGAGNLISSNGQNGIRILNGSSNIVAGNFIGTNAAGTAALSNSGNGVAICGSTNNTVGGTSTAARNVISGNTLAGVNICSISSANLVQGNYIGTNIIGTAVIPNSLNGVQVDGVNNTVGGVSNARNLISGNSPNGIAITGNQNTVQSNFIGTDAAGTNALGNAFAGVSILGGASNNLIGVTANTIAFNGLHGISVDNGTGNAIRGNSIFSNSGLGIDLFSSSDPSSRVTPNDSCDGDTGSNNLQNFPVISSITRSGGNITINGSLDSVASTGYVLDFFSSPSCDSSGNGEGKTFLGSVFATTDSSCAANFSVSLSTSPSELAITATATRIDSSFNLTDTSEFSLCFAAPTAIEFAGATATAYDDGVLIEWQTGFEVDNLGFNLYREATGKRLLLNPQPVVGSALLIGPSTALGAGHSYAWWEAGVANDHSAAYWIEDLDLNWQSTWHGPIAVSDASGSAPAKTLKQARLLSDPGHAQTDSAPVETKAGLPAIEGIKLFSLEPARSDLQNQLASGPAVKIAVKREGWYRVTQPELIQAGLDPKADPHSLQLYVDGEPIPITVTGESDGRFDADDAIEFYGIGLDSPASNTRMYWLVPGAQNGLRISSLQSPAPPVQGGSFPFTIERRDRTVYFSGLLNGETENFFGDIIAAQPVDQSLNVQHLDTEAPPGATLEVVLQGVTQVSHLVRVRLNGADLGEVAFDRQAGGAASFDISRRLLREGQTQVTLSAQIGPDDVSLVDYIRLTYRHAFTADHNMLKLPAASGQRLTIAGFSNEQVRVFDITDPAAVQEIGGLIEKREDGYAVSVTAPCCGQRVLLALSDDQARRAAKLKPNAASNWRRTNAGADLIIIHHDELAILAPLIAARQRQGLSVAAVDVEDIFDEFSFGEKSPQAIKDFLAFARTNWKKKPRYVLIVGDASYDSRDYLGFGDSDLVPTKLIDTNYMEAASDDWFVDFDNDGMPELAIGRLPARTREEAEAMITRLIGYDESRPADEILLVADVVDGYDFEAANARLKALLPDDVKAVEIKRGELGDQARPALIAAINRGQQIVNYTGHGSANQWRGDLLTNATASALINQEHLSLFVMMTCLNGYFDDPAVDSLAESLLKAPRGGGIAVWASSAMTSPIDQGLLNQQFYRQLYSNRTVRIGDAARVSKAAVSDKDVQRTWILFGDPTMRLR